MKPGAISFLGLAAALLLAAQPEPARKVFWAFRAPVKAEPPAGIAAAEHPIDAFVLAKLRAKNLNLSPRAAAGELTRRLHFDLTGLPPAPADYAVPYAEAIEKLLASPRYGERWGRHWLDVVRFGETDGGEHNYERWQAWRYRDYVIEAFNQDKPYPQFIREQIAGDLLEPENPRMAAATGFLVAGPWDQVSAEINKDKIMTMNARLDELDDMVTTTFHTFQALTVNCARCHNHKFDPIPAKDFYKLTAVFRGVTFGTRTVAPAAEIAAYDARMKPLKQELAALQSALGKIENPVLARLQRARYEAFDRARAGEPRRIPLNPVFNRNQFAPREAAHWRMAITKVQGKRAKLAEVRLGTFVALRNWTAEAEAKDDAPVYAPLQAPPTPGAVSDIYWSTDAATAQRDGMPMVYRLEASADGAAWAAVCSSLDHIRSLELDLPAVTPDEVAAQLDAASAAERTRLLSEIARVNRSVEAVPEPTKVYGARPAALTSAHLLDRGSVTKPVEEVLPGALTAVAQLPPDFGLTPQSTDRERRLALADWIASPHNPLTARVMVNRVWAYHFGTGLVNTPSDFGVMGDRPSHPELLDWLAVWFMENGWSVKKLHRLILTSRAYQQSSAMQAEAAAIDSDNRLYWRMSPRRLDAESLRDAMLALSGHLRLDAGGPSFLLQKRGDRGSYIYKALENDGPEVWKRAVYRFVVRGGERIMMDSFDCPDPAVASPQRTVSNTAVQALTLFNNQFVLRQSGLLAQRLQRDHAADPVAGAYRLLFGRAPREPERRRAETFLRGNSLELYCRVLLNTNEFVYVP
ncbi:MAG: DUF1553 domain-containing protein [Bryobacterales bacterium]|nr:DUF1553 domain-containing protein [Bryobacterales bacterium]